MAIRIRLLDSAVKPREVILRVSTTDVDGDEPEYQREITPNPGVWQGAWLYARLPSQAVSVAGVTVSAYEASEERDGNLIAGELLARTTFAPAQLISPADGLIGVVGQRPYGLVRYALRVGNEDYAPLGHELTKVEAGLSPGDADFPDRWYGLAAFEVIVWGEGDPSLVRSDRAVALREWVKRGGHLVIILPAVGENWTNSASNELYDLVPAVSVRRREGVDLDSFRLLLTNNPTKPLPKDAVVHEFTPLPDASIGEASRVLNDPDGNCVVARRLVGAGAVTMVGLDLNNRMLSDFEGIEPSVFWNRLLGRRGRLETQTQLDARARAGSLPSRQEVPLDQGIASMIDKKGSVVTGVLLGFVVFLAYWVLAGPGGYGLLKWKGLVRHSWLAYVLTGAFFTAVAWGGAALMRDKRVLATHLTVLDHVYGQPTERARAWFNVLIPWYGNATISIGDQSQPNSRPEFHDTIAPWEPAERPATDGGFTDVRGYTIDARNPASMRVPARSTVKQVVAEWAGGPPWKMPFPPPYADGSPSRITLKPNRRPEEGWLQGALVHDLPAPLHDVMIFIIPRQKPLDTSGGDLGNQLICDARAFAIDEWKPGAANELDLDAVTTPRSAGDDSTAASHLRNMLARYRSNTFGATTPDSGAYPHQMLAAGFVHQFEPPELDSQRADSFPLAVRTATHGWDLGRYFTQPCVLIVGHLGTKDDPAASPVPLYLDGEPVPTEGRTIVRWIYPLTDAPPAVTRDVSSQSFEAPTVEGAPPLDIQPPKDQRPTPTPRKK